VDTIHAQQIKTYSLFPSQLPFSPDTSGLEPMVETPVAVQPTVTTDNIETTPDVAEGTRTSPVTSDGNSSQEEGKGCLPALLTMFGLLKK